MDDARFLVLPRPWLLSGLGPLRANAPLPPLQRSRTEKHVRLPHREKLPACENWSHAVIVCSRCGCLPFTLWPGDAELQPEPITRASGRVLLRLRCRRGYADADAMRGCGVWGQLCEAQWKPSARYPGLTILVLITVAARFRQASMGGEAGSGILQTECKDSLVRTQASDRSSTCDVWWAGSRRSYGLDALRPR